MNDESVLAMVERTLSSLERGKDSQWDRDVRRFSAEMLRRGDADYESISIRAIAMADAVEKARKRTPSEAH